MRLEHVDRARRDLHHSTGQAGTMPACAKPWMAPLPGLHAHPVGPNPANRQYTGCPPVPIQQTGGAQAAHHTHTAHLRQAVDDTLVWVQVRLRHVVAADHMRPAAAAGAPERAAHDWGTNRMEKGRSAWLRGKPVGSVAQAPVRKSAGCALGVAVIASKHWQRGLGAPAAAPTSAHQASPGHSAQGGGAASPRAHTSHSHALPLGASATP